MWVDLGAVRAGRVYRMDHDFWGAADHHATHSAISDVTAAMAGRTDPAV